MPPWLPDDAPAPLPGTEISTIHFYINDNNEAVVYDPETTIVPYTSVRGKNGTATIYWTMKNQVFWSVTSVTKAYMLFSGNITSNQGGSYGVGDVGGAGYVSGTKSIPSYAGRTTTVTLNGFMIDAWGISFTLPGVSSSYYRSK